MNADAKRLYQSDLKYQDTSNAEDKYSWNLREKFQLPIQMQLSKKVKTFYKIFISFIKSL